MTSTYLSNNTDQLQMLIAVDAPYFALEDIQLKSPNTIEAFAPIQKPVGNELSLMANSETGRHLAIAGSLACALVNPTKKKHYYLASNAVYTNLQFGNFSSEEHYSRLVVRSTCIELEKRQAKSINYLLTPNGEALARIEVDYYILSTVLFEKLNRHHYNASPELLSSNPYNENQHAFPLHFDNEGTSAYGDFGPIKTEYCTGHFNGFPAFPVAEIIHYLYKGSIQLLEHHLEITEIKYEPKRAIINAEQLGFVKEQVLMDWKIKERDGNWFLVEGTAIANMEKIIGRLELELCVRSINMSSDKP